MRCISSFKQFPTTSTAREWLSIFFRMNSCTLSIHTKFQLKILKILRVKNFYTLSSRITATILSISGFFLIDERDSNIVQSRFFSLRQKLPTLLYSRRILWSWLFSSIFPDGHNVDGSRRTWMISICNALGDDRGRLSDNRSSYTANTEVRLKIWFNFSVWLLNSSASL